jgi:hypothetical protein
MLALDQNEKFLESGAYIYDREEIVIRHYEQSALHELT